jgi:hypothetical protein
MKTHLAAAGGILLITLVAAGGYRADSFEASGPPTLVELCRQFPTDKCPYHHNYVEIYETLFGRMRNAAIRFLEIGVLHGNSVRLWEAYFPNAQIYGLDIDESTTKYKSARINILIGDQGNRADLTKVLDATGRELDVVLDDGGHAMHQQQLSLGVLFPAIKNGGLYIVEDVHTSFPELYPGYGVGPPDGRNSTYALIDRFVRTGRFTSQYLTDAENEYLTKNVSYCAYYLRQNGLHSDFFACWKR